MTHLIRRSLDLAFIRHRKQIFKDGVSGMTDAMNYLINFPLKDLAISCLDYIVEVLDINFQQARECLWLFSVHTKPAENTASF